MPLYRRSSMRTRALLAVLAVVSLVALFTTRVSRKMPDFEVYWTAGSRALAAQPLYRPEDGHFQFKYLPAFAVLSSPLALMPLPAAKALWFSVSAILMVTLLGLSVIAIPQPRRAPALLVVLTFLAMAKFYAHELVLGQVNLLFGVIVTLGLVLLRWGRDARAGVLFALAVVVKPYALVLAPWLATRRRRLAFLVMAGGLVLAFVLPALRYGWKGNLDLHAEWLQTVRETSAPNLANQDNVSLASMFSRWISPAPAAQTLSAAAAGILLFICAVVMAGRGSLVDSDPLEMSLLLILIPLLSPQGWDYVFLIATPGVMLLIDRLASVPRELRIAATVAMVVVAVTIYDVLGRDRYAFIMALSVITICFVIEFAALVTLRFRRVA
jgi:glycosyl transferase family 87